MPYSLVGRFASTGGDTSRRLWGNALPAGRTVPVNLLRSEPAMPTVGPERSDPASPLQFPDRIDLKAEDSGRFADGEELPHGCRRRLRPAAEPPLLGQDLPDALDLDEGNGGWLAGNFDLLNLAGADPVVD